MKKWIAAGVLYVLTSAAAHADVEICNKTGRTLQLAIAHPITEPYLTKEISGWYPINSGKCMTAVKGNVSVSFPFYFRAEYMDATMYQVEGETVVYDLCVADQAFTRRGSWQELARCPSGYYTREFYGTDVPPEGLTLEFN